MKIVQLEEKIIQGLSVRTNNANEMKSDTAQIAKLHKSFDEKFIIDYVAGNRAYGAYYNYESDALGEFSVLAGTDQLDHPSVANAEKLTLVAGKYLVFEAKGTMPQVVIDVWGEIWTYFDLHPSEYVRAYKTDFEYYKSENEVTVYIGIE